MIARETSLFAIERVEVRGGSRGVDAQVARRWRRRRRSLLVGLDGAAVLREARRFRPWSARPTTARSQTRCASGSCRSDPSAVLRDGADSVGRVRAGPNHRASPGRRQPDAAADVVSREACRLGEVLSASRRGARGAAIAAGGARSRPAAPRRREGMLVFHLRSGIELLLGAPAAIALKVAVAEHTLRACCRGTRRRRERSEPTGLRNESRDQLTQSSK